MAENVTAFAEEFYDWSGGYRWVRYVNPSPAFRRYAGMTPKAFQRQGRIGYR